MNAAFKNSAVWQSGLKNTVKLAQTQQKRVESCLQELGNPKKSTFHDSLKTAEESFLAPDYPQLLSRLDSFASNPQEKIAESDLTHFKNLVTERKEIEEAGTKAVQQINQEILRPFLEKNSSWVPPAEK